MENIAGQSEYAPGAPFDEGLGNEFQLREYPVRLGSAVRELSSERSGQNRFRIGVRSEEERSDDSQSTEASF